jgi:adenine-specific DNA-methyltransferase
MNSFLFLLSYCGDVSEVGDEQVPNKMTWYTVDLQRTPDYPRLRYMGSKYRVVPYLASILSRVPSETALDGFSGSGVFAYALKEIGENVTSTTF